MLELSLFAWTLFCSATYAPHIPFPVAKAKALLSMLKPKDLIPLSLMRFKAVKDNKVMCPHLVFRYHSSS